MVDEHLDELAFLLHLRESLIPFSRLDVRELVGLDRRIAAHIQGLLLRETRSWDRLLALITARPTKDRLRMAGVVALNAGSSKAIGDYLRWLDNGPANAPFADEVVRWVSPRHRARALTGLGKVGDSSDFARAIWIELANLDGTFPQDWSIMVEQLLALTAAAPHTARALSRVSTSDGLLSLQFLVDHRDGEVRAGALCALMALGNQDAASRVWGLQDVTTSFSTSLYLRAFLRSPAAGSELRLAQLWDIGCKEASVLAICASGRRALLPPLVKIMNDPTVARLAGRVFELMSGHVTTQPSIDNLSAEPSNGNRAYEHLRPPDPKAAAEWLAGPGQALPEHEPLIGGLVRTDGLCLEALRHGDCTSRYLFSEVLSVCRPDLVDLDIRAPMYEQLRHAAMSTSGST